MSKSDSTGETHASLPGDAEQTPRHRAALERFVLLWGEMASSWGINRTMAQIHALLYASEDALDTDTIMARLGISRGNANMNLRSLINWNLVRKVHQAGSRRDYYAAEKDVWAIMARIIAERHRREIRPVRQQLEACRAELAAGDAILDDEERQLGERIDNLIELMDVFDGFSGALLPFIQPPRPAVIRQLIQLAHAFHDPAATDAPAPRDDAKQ